MLKTLSMTVNRRSGPEDGAEGGTEEMVMPGLDMEDGALETIVSEQQVESQIN